MRRWIHALRVKAVVICESMHKRAVGPRRRLEAKPTNRGIIGKGAEIFFELGDYGGGELTV
jgi:hypothetical protein